MYFEDCPNGPDKEIGQKRGFCNRLEPSADVLALLGSPRRGGNTDRLLSRVLAKIDEPGFKTEKITVADLKISPCREIYACLQTGRCAINDDMTPIYDQLTSARVVILASPIFFYGPSAQIKTLIDRTQALWARKYVLKAGREGDRGRGYLLSVAATRGQKVFDGFILTAKYFFDILNLDLSGRLLIRGVDQAGEIDRHPEALAQAEDLGREIADFLSDKRSFS